MEPAAPFGPVVLRGSAEAGHLRMTGLVCRRASSPPSLRLRATGRLLLSSSSPEGACGTLDGSPRPRRHALSNAAHGSVHPEQVDGGVCPRGSHDPAGRTTAGSPKTQETACVPHANGLCGLLHVPKAPFRRRLSVRASYCPDMHLGRPPVLPVVSPRPPSRKKAARSPASWRPPQPAPRHENAHEAPLPERDGRTIFL